MVICIVTVYDSINCGSYWQAFALSKAIKELGYNVVFLRRDKRNGASSSLKCKMIRLSKNIKNYGIKCGIRYLKSLKQFSVAHNALTIIDNTASVDCFVLGSDTIWNMESKYFSAHYKKYWGIEFFPKSVISYAASAANTPSYLITEEMKNAICNMSAVSVRDRYTLTLINSDRANVKIVCDPTLLIDTSFYKEHFLPKRKYKYIYLYLFASISKENAKALKNFALMQNLKIVNGASVNIPEYCDEGSIVSPNQFITDIYHAEYVITDTFHGSIFSIIFNKQFVAINRKKNKVFELLESIDLKERIVEENEIVKMIDNEIDYRSVNDITQSFKNTSIEFLRNELSHLY